MMTRRPSSVSVNRRPPILGRRGARARRAASAARAPAMSAPQMAQPAAYGVTVEPQSGQRVIALATGPLCATDAFAVEVNYAVAGIAPGLAAGRGGPPPAPAAAGGAAAGRGDAVVPRP